MKITTEKDVTTKVQELSKGCKITSIPKIIADKLDLKKGDILNWDLKKSKMVVEVDNHPS